MIIYILITTVTVLISNFSLIVLVEDMGARLSEM